MTPEYFAEILGLGHETQGVEFKGPFARSNKDQFTEVVRAVLGMANRRDGGLVIIGVDEHNPGSGKTVNPVGMSTNELEGWDQDAVQSSVNSYADPFVDLDVERVTHDNKDFVVLRVREFEELPVLCKKPYSKQKGAKEDIVLREGGCYVRRRGRIESSEIPSHVEMRNLLELATEKAIRRFLQQALRVGLPVSAQSPSDAELFDRQREDFR